MSKALPPGWIEFADEQSGLPYYYNENTKETTWSRPEPEDEDEEEEERKKQEKDVSGNSGKRQKSIQNANHHNKEFKCGKCAFAKATLYCNDCKRKYCESCCMSVHMLNSHFIQEISGLSLCGKHENLLARYFCFNCKTSFCQTCSTSPAHFSHRILSSEEVVKFAIRDNNEAMVSNFAKQLNKGVSFLETLLKVAKEEQRRVEQNIIQEGDYPRLALANLGLFAKLLADDKIKAPVQAQLRYEEEEEDDQNGATSLDIVEGNFEQQELGIVAQKAISSSEPKLTKAEKARQDEEKLKQQKAAGDLSLHTFSGHTQTVWGLAFQRRGNSFASCSEDRYVRIWSPSLKNWECQFMEPSGVRSVTFIPPDDRLIMGLQNATIVMRVNDPKPKETVVKGHTKPVGTLSISPKIGVLASGSDDATVRLWDFTKGMKSLGVLKLHKEDVTCVICTETKVFSSSQDYSVKVVDLKTQKPFLTFSDSAPPLSLHLEDENTLFIGFQDGKIRCYDLRDITKPKNVFAGHEKGGVTCLCGHNYGSDLVSGGLDNNVKVWSIRKADLLTTFTGHKGYVRDVQSDGDNLYSCSDDATVKLWNLSASNVVI